MGFSWIEENPPHWDEPKARIVGGAPKGAFEIGEHAQGDLVPGEWWRVEDDAGVAGYGWMDITWGDAEILLVVDPERQGAGVGTFILDHLEKEAGKQGLNYLYNVVRPTHPDREGITSWLTARRFEGGHEDEGLLRRAIPHE